MVIDETNLQLTFRGNTQEAWVGRVALSLVMSYCEFSEEERERLNRLLLSAEDEADGVLAVPIDESNPPF